MKACKVGLLAVFLLVVFDGALRKWVAPGLSTPLLLLKDGVLLLSVGFYLFDRSRSVGLPYPMYYTAVPWLLGLYAFIVVAQALNPHIPNMEIRILGLRSHLLYVALLFLVPAVATRARNPFWWLKAYIVAIAVPVLLLGIYQYFLPASHWLNAYVGEQPYIATAAGAARITGTFSYIEGMTTFLQVNLALGIGMGLAGLWFRRSDLVWWGGGLFLLAMVVSPMNGSRGLFFFLALPSPFVLWQMAKKPGGRMRILVAGSLLVILLAGIVTQTQLGAGFDTFLQRVETSNDAETRVSDTFLGTPVAVMGRAGITGYGVGTSHQAAFQLKPADAELPTVENRVGSLMLELGLPGYAVFLMLHIALMVVAYRLMDQARGPFPALVAVTAFLFCGSSLMGDMVYNVTVSATYWGLLGLVITESSRQEVQWWQRLRAASGQRALSNRGA